MSWFQSEAYLKAFAESFCEKKDLIELKEGSFEKVGDKVVFLGMKPVLGGQEVTDYGDIPDPTDWPEILKQLKEKGYKKLQLDYVREDSGTYTHFAPTSPPLRQGFAGLRRASRVKQEVSPYIDLPKTWEEYLVRLPRRERKELKRKIKRLEETDSFYSCSEETVKADFEDFVRLHRLSDPQKGKFMSEEMKQFFWQVKTMQAEGWRQYLCFLKLENKPVASVMTLESDSEVWLYNSGFDPNYSYYSVGLLLKAYKIKKAIEEGKKRYDFLRGAERYKYDLGGKDLGLYRIEVDL